MSGTDDDAPGALPPTGPPSEPPAYPSYPSYPAYPSEPSGPPEASTPPGAPTPPEAPTPPGAPSAPPAYPGSFTSGLAPMNLLSVDDGDRFRPQLEIDGPERQSRLTVFFRLLIAIPQLIVLFVLAVAAEISVVIGWFCALVIGRLPGWVASMVIAYLSFSTRTSAYLWLATGRYPGFSLAPDEGSVRIELRPGRLNRWAVLFRLFLLIPADIVAGALRIGFAIIAFFVWLIVLIMGRMPGTLFLATAAMIRLQLRVSAYGFMASDAYPLPGLLGERAMPSVDEPAPRTRTRPLLLTSGARALVIVLLVVGALGYVGSLSYNVAHDGDAFQAREDTVSSYNAYVDEANNGDARLKACQKVACVQTEFGRLESRASDLEHTLRTTTYPSSDRDDVGRARDAVAAVVSSAHAIRTAPASGVRRAIERSNIDAELSAADRAMHTLLDELP